MFKSARWRSEKNKIKVVFKLQFHATQVAGDALMISVVPADVGKPTLKLEKAIVRDGSCYWDKAVFETVKLIQEPKSGKIHEKIYYFILGTGSSKAGVVGEASIDFSNHAEASKISSVALPLKNSKSGAVLHVSIQRIQDSADQSVVEEIENAKPDSDDRILRMQPRNDDVEASLNGNSTEDGLINKPILHDGVLNGNRRVSGESDITMSSSGSSSGLDTPRQIKTRTNISHQDHMNFPSSPNLALVPRNPSVDVSTTVYEENQQLDWLGGSALEVSTDGSSSTPREALQRLASQEVSDIVVATLQSELAAFARQVEVSDLELQTLRKQIVKECKRGQDLSKEVASLKKERDAFKEECDKLKTSQRRLDEAKSKDKLLYERGDLQTLVSELRQELSYQKDLNANLEIQLQKTQESNSELILAVRDLDEMLEQKNKENVSLSNKSTTSFDAERFPDVISKHEMTDEDDEEQKALEQLVREHSDVKDTYMLEQKVTNLHGEIEIYKRERDDLEMQMEQLALDNEILKQENHDMLYKLEQSELQEQLKMQYECATSYATVSELEAQIVSLENELKNQSKEFSDSLATISELEAQVSNLEQELEQQAQGFEADLDTLSRDKIEQEQRAIRAEEALRKTRRQNVITAERLQEELKGLSMQMECSLKASETLATKALNEANELCLQKMLLEKMLQKSFEELQSIKEHYEAKVFELSSQVNNMSDQMEKLQSEIEEKSVLLGKQEVLAKETEQHLSQKIISLKEEIENLLTENIILSQHEEHKNTLANELEKTRKSIEDMQLVIEQGHSERRELETRLALVEREAMDTVKELNSTRSLIDEKDTLVAELHLEVDILICECKEMKSSLFEDELEKEILRKQVSRLKDDLIEKENALNSLDEKLEDANDRFASLKEIIKLLEGQIKLKENALDSLSNSFTEKEKDLQDKIEELERRLEELRHSTERLGEQKSQKVVTEDLNLAITTCTEDENTCQTSSTESSNICSSDKEMENAASNTGNLEVLSKEMELLRERNKLMEVELKEMQGRYSEISLKFAEVEGERQKLVMRMRNIKSAKKSS
ncbi:uncharacterized protein [Nicotiana tomentosiformis]|uniref:uncharacterized protein isoform X1 n=1 Tax=Nicotiana tomentosiformis TaxID=4098 RepID=UPI00051B41B2|nr:myosin-13-like isoform X1 [Nicotiana tomentosiformis]